MLHGKEGPQLKDARGHSRCVIFLHVPKAAGQTLNAILARQYDPRATVVITDPSSVTRALDRGAGPPALVRGHVPYGIHEEIGIDARYITMLREPVSRVVSVYGYVWHNPRHPLHTLVRSKGMTLKDFVTRDVDREDVVNGQTRLIAGRSEADPDSTALLRAKQHLRDMAAVGVVERFDESVMLFRERLDWMVPFYTKRNVAPQRSDTGRLSPDVRELIESMNRLDIDLYHDALSLFDENVATAGALFGARVVTFRLLNRLAGTYVALRDKASRTLSTDSD
jgi:hypothetical protein